MSRRTVLIVDDEAAQRDLMRGILQQESWSVLEASDYQEALAVQQQHPGEIAVLVIDLRLPGGNGFDLSKSLLAREPHLKVLFVSGQAGAELRRFLDVTVPEVHFLQKPFQPPELLEHVKAVLESAGPFVDTAREG
ncbi:MAG TPA: response regulator [Bryobacteraceae bacterium]|nr:response regulator [Bryobacteraceae bacterium]